MYLLYIWVEPVLNHEIVRAVLTERQTSDCDVKCRITFSFQWKFHIYWPQYRVEHQYDDFAKVMPRQYGVFSTTQVLYSFSKISRERDFLASKHYGSLQKKTHKFIVDECASHVTLFSTQALSLELAALAINTICWGLQILN